MCAKLFVSVWHYVKKKICLSLNVNIGKLLLNIIFGREGINIFNTNRNINKFSFSFRKIKLVEMKCILERFSLQRNKAKVI